MSRFTSTKVINSRWRNNDFIGAAGSSHTFPDQFHDEFLVDWEQQIADGSIVITETPTTGNIQMASLTVGDIVLTGTATGFPSAPTIVGTAPINVVTASSTSTISLNANYQTAGTYVTSVSGTAPITASGTTAVTVGIDQTALTVAASTNAEVLRLYVKNSTGTTLNKGQPVYISSSDGNNAEISLASATNDATSSKTLGLLAQTLLTGEHGYVIENGLLAGIDTSTATAGQAVWLSATAGQVVYGTPPAEPAHGVYLGVVTRVQSNNGAIAVKVQNGYEIDELHDVSAGSPSDGDIIQYKTSSALWTKQSVSQAGIAASVHTHAYQPAGTYVTAVNGTAPIAASTDTAGIVSVSLTATYSSSTHDHSGVYQVAGNYATNTHTHTLPPTGSIVMWTTTAAPSGWLFCDGSAYSYNTYPDLGALFGGTPGGNFNVPDLRDRFIAGSATISAASNNTGTFAPNTANTHTHTTDIAHGHADTIAVSTHGDHTHSTNPAATTSGTPSLTVTSLTQTGSASAGASTHTHSTDIAATTSGAESTNLTHTVTGGVTSLGTTSVTSSSGSLLPKAALLNFIIKS